MRIGNKRIRISVIFGLIPILHSNSSELGHTYGRGIAELELELTRGVYGEMALNIAYKYRVQVPEVSQRKLEGLKVKRRYPGKIPVSTFTMRSSHCV